MKTAINAIKIGVLNPISVNLIVGLIRGGFLAESMFVVF